ncbi:MAG: PadR family transcriptional regulator [Fimbriimonadales bacterium]
MALDRQLSQLELTVLGVVMKRGRCVAHAVVNEFAGSQTFAYRSGAGSIYPLLERLAKAGYLVASERKYSITESGLGALRDWVRPPLDPESFSTNLDEIRSRVYFLRLLSPHEIDEFVKSAVAGLEGVLEECKAALDAQRASGDRFGEFAMLGAVRETEARIAWLTELGEGLVSSV